MHACEHSNGTSYSVKGEAFRDQSTGSSQVKFCSVELVIMPRSVLFEKNKDYSINCMVLIIAYMRCRPTGGTNNSLRRLAVCFRRSEVVGIRFFWSETF